MRCTNASCRARFAKGSIDPSARFCPNCGTAFGPGSEEESRGFSIGVAVVIFLVTCLTIGALASVLFSARSGAVPVRMPFACVMLSMIAVVGLAVGAVVARKNDVRRM